MRGLAEAGLPLSLRPEQLPRELREHRRALRAAGEEREAREAREALEAMPRSGPREAAASANSDAASAEKRERMKEGDGAAKEGSAGSAGSDERGELALTRETVEAALTETMGSVRAAAHRLGIDRRKLYRLCEKLGIDLDRYRSSPKKED
jgi:DNA-binding NtrC family response regulator